MKTVGRCRRLRHPAGVRGGFLAAAALAALAVLAPAAFGHARATAHRAAAPNTVTVGLSLKVSNLDPDLAVEPSNLDALHLIAGTLTELITPARSAARSTQTTGAAADPIRDLDARADLYALGTMLFELITGKPAWPGDSVIAIAAGLAVLLPVETILTDAIPGTARWLPAQLLEAIAQGGSATAPFGAALMTVSAYVLGAVVIAMLVFARRDVTA